MNIKRSDNDLIVGSHIMVYYFLIDLPGFFNQDRLEDFFLLLKIVAAGQNNMNIMVILFYPSIVT